ncbi:MAG: hypothetical protein ACOCXJ_06095 [Planctomycetota bacterium]
MSRSWRQIRAWIGVEWLRQGCSPTWAVLLVVWTLVCALFVQVVVGHLGRNELPPGENAMSFFFRGTPWLLPLLLVVFLPHLGTDAIAARRASGRLEQLRLAGVASAAVVIGAFCATLLLIGLLALVPLLLHGIISLHGQTDLGQTAAALAALGCIATSLAALALCASCWAPHRTAAGLIALALGLAWWIIDLFGHAFEQSGVWSSLSQALALRSALPLARFVHEGAIGLFAPAAAIGHGALAGTLLYLAGLGLRRGALGHRLLDGALALLCLVLLLHLLPHESRWDTTSGRHHALSESTAATAARLHEDGGLALTLVTTPEQRAHPQDRILVEATERLLHGLAEAGARWHRLDPALDPSAAAQILRNHDLDARRLAHPLLLVHHLGRSEVLPHGELATRDPESDAILALTVENAVLAAMLRLERRERHLLAWYGQPADATRTLLGNAGLRISEMPDLTGLDATRHRLLMAVGPQRDCSVQEATALRRYLAGGGRLLLALDARRAPALPRWQELLQDYGMHCDASLLGRREADGRFLPALDWNTVTDAGPLRLVHRAGAALLLPFPAAVYPGSPTRPGELLPLLPAPPDSLRWQDGRTNAIEWPHHGLLAFAGADTRLALLAGAAVLADEHLGRVGNDLLVQGLVRWLLESDQGELLPPRPVLARQYSLDRSQRLWLSWGLGLGLPVLAVLVASGILWRRRRWS